MTPAEVRRRLAAHDLIASLTAASDVREHGSYQARGQDVAGAPDSIDECANSGHEASGGRPGAPATTTMEVTT